MHEVEGDPFRGRQRYRDPSGYRRAGSPRPKGSAAALGRTSAIAAAQRSWAASGAPTDSKGRSPEEGGISSEETFASSLYSQKGLRYKDIISFIPDVPRAGPFPIRFRSPLPRLDPNGGALSFPLRTSREASHMLQCCLSWLRTIPWPGIG